jgi:hypothetical protein
MDIQKITPVKYKQIKKSLKTFCSVAQHKIVKKTNLHSFYRQLQGFKQGTSYSNEPPNHVSFV